jgi:predicted ATPase
VPDASSMGASAGAATIRTPDQRVRVFVSSTLRELAAERAAAGQAIARMHLTPVMFETGARPHPPRDLYRAYLANSEVFVGIYWQQYGWVAPTEASSGLEDEYRLSGDLPKLVYVKDATERDPRLTALLADIKADDGLSYKRFEDADELADLLGDDLAVLLSERFGAAESSEPPELRIATPPVPPTGLVGREDDLAEVLALLRDPDVRLVTVTGPGGIGKTRLALEVTRLVGSSTPTGPAGVSFVDLAPVRDPSTWTAAVAEAHGIHPEGTRRVLPVLIDRLQGRPLLLVLDNFEQVVAAAEDLSELLAACPELTVLATSRAALHLRSEREVPLSPLAIPVHDEGGDENDPLAAIEESASVRLLVEAARRVRPSFVLTAANARAVAELCRRLDGIPLAVELAAAQLRLLTPAELLRRLGDALDLVADTVDAPARHRTLRATIDWSYGLLGEDERALLARLSVFSGAWTVEACEAVGAADGDLDALATLSSLAAQSLIRTEPPDADSALRFRMLDTIRAYGTERLIERGESDATVARLATYLVDVVGAVRDALQGPEHRAAGERLDRERDEILSSIRWALRNDDARTVGRLLAPLFTYWWSRGQLAMTSEVAEKASALPSAAHLEPYDSALLRGVWGMAMVMTGRATEAEPLLRETLETATTLGNVRLRAYALLGLGWTAVNRAATEANERLDEAAEQFRRFGDSWGLAVTLSTRGQYALLVGDHDAALRIHVDALEAASAIDNDNLRAHALDMLGLDAYTTGDFSGALEHYAAAAGLHASVLDYEGAAYCLSGLAGVALAQARPQVAARLVGASEHARHVVGVGVWPGMQAATDALVEAVGVALGRPAFADTRAQGAHLRVPDALEYALAASSVDAEGDPFDAFSSRLIAGS